MTMMQQSLNSSSINKKYQYKVSYLSLMLNDLIVYNDNKSTLAEMWAWLKEFCTNDNQERYVATGVNIFFMYQDDYIAFKLKFGI